MTKYLQIVETNQEDGLTLAGDNMGEPEIDLFADEKFKYKLAASLLNKYVKMGLLTEEEAERCEQDFRKLYNIKKERRTPLE